MISGGYRSQRITTHEVRFNPAKRNRGGERDLDAIVMAAVHGIDRASLEYPVRAGLILMMDRGFPPELNAAIVERAIRFRDRGVVADRHRRARDPAGRAAPYPYRDLAPLVERARDAGLGVTLHAGEEGVNAPDPGPFLDEMRQVLDLGVDRIGHGIITAMEPRLLEQALETRRGARDLPHLERAHRGRARRGADGRDRLRPRGGRRPAGGRHRRAGDDRDPPAHRVRACSCGAAPCRGRPRARPTTARTP